MVDLFCNCVDNFFIYLQFAYNLRSHCSDTDNKNNAMSTEEVIKALKHHQKWRKGAEIEMLHPKYLGEVIDEAIKLLEEDEHRESK